MSLLSSAARAFLDHVNGYVSAGRQNPAPSADPTTGTAVEDGAHVAVFDEVAVPPSSYVSTLVEPFDGALSGRGVRTRCRVRPGEVLERAAVLLVPPDEREQVTSSALGGFVYEFDGGVALALGCGSLYNHSATPNAEWVFDDDGEAVTFYALEDLEPGVEVLIDYSGGDPAALWFDPL